MGRVCVVLADENGHLAKLLYLYPDILGDRKKQKKVKYDEI